MHTRALASSSVAAQPGKDDGADKVGTESEALASVRGQRFSQRGRSRYSYAPTSLECIDAATARVAASAAASSLSWEKARLEWQVTGTAHRFSSDNEILRGIATPSSSSSASSASDSDGTLARSSAPAASASTLRYETGSTVDVSDSVSGSEDVASDGGKGATSATDLVVALARLRAGNPRRLRRPRVYAESIRMSLLVRPEAQIKFTRPLPLQSIIAILLQTWDER